MSILLMGCIGFVCLCIVNSDEETRFPRGVNILICAVFLGTIILDLLGKL